MQHCAPSHTWAVSNLDPAMDQAKVTYQLSIDISALQDEDHSEHLPSRVCGQNLERRIPRSVL